MPKRPSFQQAKAQFVHRFTMEHVPDWARKAAPNGKYYAPHFRTDQEWYDATRFHGESPIATRTNCHTGPGTWPCGQWLEAPFKRA